MAGRPGKPIDLLLMEGKNHLTKEIKHARTMRQDSEWHNIPGATR